MKKEKKYIEYILKQAEALLAIDSPSGFTEKVTDYPVSYTHLTLPTT